MNARMSKAILNRFKDFKQRIKSASVLIVGDIMLDEYLYGTVQRVSPEAPVPIVNLESKRQIAGGAANVAMNVAGLGARPYLIGLVGSDIKGVELKEVLSKEIPVDGIISSEQRRTTIKTRVIAHHQQIVRIDQEDAISVTGEEINKLWNYLEKILDDVQIIVISDYDKGITNGKLLARLIKYGRSNGLPIIVDPKGKNFQKYKGATLITPNKSEFLAVSKLRKTESLEKDLYQSAAKSLIKKLQLEALLVTLGEHGMCLYQKNKVPDYHQASARRVYDVTGAGDTVVATLSTLLGAGYPIEEATEVANFAAGMVVEEVGTTSITIERLIEELDKS